MAATVDIGERFDASYAIYLEACDEGVNPKTRVRALLWDPNGVREQTRLFETLEEALAYAQSLYQLA